MRVTLLNKLFSAHGFFFFCLPPSVHSLRPAHRPPLLSAVQLSVCAFFGLQPRVRLQLYSCPSFRPVMFAFRLFSCPSVRPCVLVCLVLVVVTAVQLSVVASVVRLSAVQLSVGASHHVRFSAVRSPIGCSAVRRCVSSCSFFGCSSLSVGTSSCTAVRGCALRLLSCPSVFAFRLFRCPSVLPGASYRSAVQLSRLRPTVAQLPVGASYRRCVPTVSCTAVRRGFLPFQPYSRPSVRPYRILPFRRTAVRRSFLPFQPYSCPSVLRVSRTAVRRSFLPFQPYSCPSVLRVSRTAVRRSFLPFQPYSCPSVLRVSRIAFPAVQLLVGTTCQPVLSLSSCTATRRCYVSDSCTAGVASLRPFGRSRNLSAAPSGSRAVA